MELMSVSDWLWGVRERGEPRTMASAGLGQHGGSIYKEQTQRTDLGRKDYHFRRLTLRWDAQCMSLRCRRRSGIEITSMEAVSTRMGIQAFQGVSGQKDS